MTKKWSREERLHFTADEYKAANEAYDSSSAPNFKTFLMDSLTYAWSREPTSAQLRSVQRLLFIREAERRDSELRRLATLAHRGLSGAEKEFLEACKEYDVSPDEYMGIAMRSGATGTPAPEVNTEAARCQTWLRSILSDGEKVNSSDLISMAQEAGYSYITLYRSSQFLGVERSREGNRRYVQLSRTLP